MSAAAIKTAFTAVALCGIAGMAFAGPLSDAALKIETELAAGNSEVAIDAARELFSTVVEQSPTMILGNTLLVAEPAVGYGIYNPRPNEMFKAKEPIYVYAEPLGFGYGEAGEGLFAIGFHVDLRVMTEIGEPLADVPNVTELNIVTRYKVREFQANITYNLDGIEPGRYLLLTTLRDKNSDKTASFETVIEIVE